MPEISDVAAYREPYEVIGHLYIHSPVPIFKARAVHSYIGGILYPTTELIYEDVTLGDYTLIRRGMWVWLGTTDGAHDLGIQRVKDITVSTIYVGWSSNGTQEGELDIQPDAYITVFEDYPVMTKTPFISLSNGDTFKDFDEDWTINKAKVVIANGGGDVAGFIDPDTTYFRVTHSATDSLTVAGSITGYSWQIGDGVLVAGYTLSDDEIEVDYPYGFHTAYVTVGNSFGNLHTKRINVLADDRENLLSTTLGAKNVSRTLSISGQRVTFQYGDVDINEEDFPQGAYVMYWEEEFYGGVAGSLNRPLNRAHMKFIGWIASSNVTAQGTEDGRTQEATLECLDVGGMLQNLVAFSQTISRTPTPSRWEESDVVNIDNYIIYLLYWHSTVLEIADIYLSGTGNTYKFPYLGSSGGNLYDQVQQVADAMAHNLHCLQEGILKVIPDPLLHRNDAGLDERTDEVIIDLTEADIASIRFRRQRPKVHWMEEAAIIAGDTVQATQGIAAGAAPSQSPQSSSNSEQVVVDTDECLWRLGNRFARTNARFSNLTITLTHTGDAGIAPVGEWVTITAAGVSPRRYEFTGQRALVIEAQREFDAERGVVVSSITVELETFGKKAAYVEPATADTPSYIPPYISYPQADSGFVSSGYLNLALFTAEGNLLRTANFTDAEPTYTTTSLGVTGNITGFSVNAYSPKYLGTGTTVNGWLATWTSTQARVYFVDDIFGTPSLTLKFTSSAGDLTNSYVNIHSERITPNFVIASWYDNVLGTRIVKTTDNSTFTEVGITAHLTGNPYGFRQTPALAVVGAGVAYCAAYSATGSNEGAAAKLYKTTDSGANWAISHGNLKASLGFSLHIPFHNNPAKDKMWYGQKVFDTGSGDQNVYLIYYDGATETIKSPLIGAGAAAPQILNHGIATNPVNSNQLVLQGLEWTNGNREFRSDDNGDNWVVPEPAVGGVDLGNFGCDMDSSGNAYLWGSAAYGFMRFIARFTNTAEPKEGNLSTIAPSETVIGIAGG